MKVYCPYCKKEVEYKIENRELKEFRGIEINSFENVAVCKECNEDLYVNKIENENNIRIYEKYRNKANIIKPQDIIELRRKYDISQRELTSVLGFGKMTINRYERGGMPTKSQSDYIKVLIENDHEFIKKVKEAYKKNNISQKTYERVIAKDLKNEVNNADIQELYRKFINNVLNRKPDIYNGYRVFNLELVENIISYIANKVENLTITSINKYLWFIDMLSFNQRGVSITGLTYQNQQFGPTIIDQKYKEISLLDDKYIRNDYEDDCGTKTYITSNRNYDLSKLNDSEINIINTIIDILKDKNVTDISNMSHEEEGWKTTKRFENISFEYAMNLKIVK